MNIYKFLLQGNRAATIVQLPANDLIDAYRAIAFWIDAKPSVHDGINYISLELTTIGRPLIVITVEELKELYLKTILKF